jgi:hypothetical protein
MKVLVTMLVFCIMPKSPPSSQFFVIVQFQLLIILLLKHCAGGVLFACAWGAQAAICSPTGTEL